MTYDDMQQVLTGGDELGRRLDAYASHRLSPDAATVDRMRARVMREFDVRLGAAPVAAAPVSLRRRAVALPARLRRVSGALLAASLGVAVVAGGALAATPGGPLYPVRVWVERITLPADPVARAGAELARLESRLADVLASVAENDTVGVQAALTAYTAIVDEAIAGAGATPEALAQLESHLERHQAVLLRVLGQVPEAARAAVTQAMERSGHAVDRIRAIRGSENRGNGVGPGSNGSNGAGKGNPGGPGGPGGPGVPPGPANTPDAADSDPTKSPRPTKPPKPTPTPPSPPTAEPEATPRPTPDPLEPSTPADQPKPGRTPPPQAQPNSTARPDQGGGPPADVPAGAPQHGDVDGGGQGERGHQGPRGTGA